MNLYRGMAHAGTVSLDGGGVLTAADAPDGAVLVAIRPSAFTVHDAAPRGQQRAHRLGRARCAASPRSATACG